jgi:hypothetical protein
MKRMSQEHETKIEMGWYKQGHEWLEMFTC